MIKLSFIIPAYNCEKTIKKCVDSILEFKLKDIEIIIVNDGSVDNTERVIKDNYDNINYVKYFYKTNEGQGVARNFGIKKASGKYVTFIDSDDYYLKDVFNDVFKYLSDDKYDLLVFNITKKYKDKFINNIFSKSLVEFDKLNFEILEGIIISRGKYLGLDASTCNKIYKREIILDNNLFFTSERIVASEDALFNFNFFANINHGLIIPKTVYVYVMNDMSFTHTYQSNLFDKAVNMKNELVSISENYKLYRNNDIVSSILFFKYFLLVKNCINHEFIYNRGLMINNILNNCNLKKFDNNRFESYFSLKDKILFKLILKKRLLFVKLFCFFKQRKRGLR